MKKVFENDFIRFAFWISAILLPLFFLIFDEAISPRHFNMMVYGVVGTSVALLYDIFTTAKRRLHQHRKDKTE
jgi:cation transport ATPase